MEAEGQEERSAEGPAGEDRRERAPEHGPQPLSLEPGGGGEHHEGGAGCAGQEGGGAVEHAGGGRQQHRARDEQSPAERRLRRSHKPSLTVREEHSEGHSQRGEELGPRYHDAHRLDGSADEVEGCEEGVGAESEVGGVLPGLQPSAEEQVVQRLVVAVHLVGVVEVVEVGGEGVDRDEEAQQLTRACRHRILRSLLNPPEPTHCILSGMRCIFSLYILVAARKCKCSQRGGRAVWSTYNGLSSSYGVGECSTVLPHFSNQQQRVLNFE